MKLYVLPIFLFISLNAIAIRGQAGCVPVEFDAAPQFTIGSEAHSFVTADLNGDGVTDVATSNQGGYSQGSVSVLLGDGLGGYGPPRILRTEGNTNRVGLGDVNRDGKTDLVAGSTGTQFGLWIWINDGAAGFGTPTTANLHLTFNESFYDLKIADFTGDGNGDIAALTSNRFYIFSGNGSGGFATTTNHAWLGTNSHLATGDFNGDALTDIALTSAGGSWPWEFAVALGAPSGALSLTGNHTLAGNPNSIHVGDINRNGSVDILISAVDYFQPPLVKDPYFVQPWFGNGSGSFTAGVRTGFDRSLTGAALADFNADEILDVAADFGFAVAVRNGNGDGTFQPASLRASPGSSAIQSANVNLDSNADLLLLRGGGTSSIAVLAGNGTGFSTYQPSSGGGLEMITADLNGDERADIISTYPSDFWTSELTLSVTSPTGGRLPDQVVETPKGLKDLASGDFNGDGKLDIVTAHSNNGTRNLALYLGDGNGTVAQPVTAALGTAVQRIVAADFNKDGRDDLFVVQDSGRGFVLLNAGGNAFTQLPDFAVEGLRYFVRPVVGDFNKDGNIDLVLPVEFQTVSIFLGTGTGGFASPNPFSLPTWIDSLAVGDLNGDSNLDIVGFRSSTTTILRLFGDGQGGVSRIATQDVSFGSAGSVIAADFNSDKLTDVAFAAQSSSGNIAIYPSSSQEPFGGNPVFYSVGGLVSYSGGSTRSLAAGDFNADGKVDVAYATGVTRGVLFNTSGERPCLSVDDVSVVEGDGGTTEAVFTVSLGAASAVDVRVNYSLSAGTSSAPKDLQDVSGRLLIPAGQTGATIRVPVIGDTTDEFDETFNVVLSSPANASLSRAVGVGTIVDNDAEPTLTIPDVTITESYSYGNAVFTATLSSASEKPVTFRYVTSDGTALRDLDYIPNDQALTIQAGQTSATFGLPVLGDAMYEPDEEFYVDITDLSNASLANARIKVTIPNDDQLPTAALSSGFFAETDAGTVDRPVTIYLSNSSYLPVRVSIISNDATATAGLDYVAFNRQVVVEPGQMQATFSVGIIGDALDEANEHFLINIYDVSGAVVQNPQTQVGIGDNDPPPALSVADIEVVEGTGADTTANIEVKLLAPSGRAVSVNYATAAGSASAATDFISTSGTLNFAPGQTSKFIPLTLVADSAVESAEQFTVVLSAPVNASMACSTATVTVQNDDLAGVTVRGTVSTRDGIALRNTTVSISKTGIFAQSVITDSVGGFVFYNVPVGPNYRIAVASKRYRFTTKTVDVAVGLAEQNFVGRE